MNEELEPRTKSEEMKVVDRLPYYEKQFNKIGEINDLISDLKDAFSGKPLNYEREFTANTRTSLAKEIYVHEL